MMGRPVSEDVWSTVDATCSKPERMEQSGPVRMDNEAATTGPITIAVYENNKFLAHQKQRRLIRWQETQYLQEFIATVLKMLE